MVSLVLPSRQHAARWWPAARQAVLGVVMGPGVLAARRVGCAPRVCCAGWSAGVGRVLCGQLADAVANAWCGGDDRRIAELSPQAADGDRHGIGERVGV